MQKIWARVVVRALRASLFCRSVIAQKLAFKSSVLVCKAIFSCFGLFFEAFQNIRERSARATARQPIILLPLKSLEKIDTFCTVNDCYSSKTRFK